MLMVTMVTLRRSNLLWATPNGQMSRGNCWEYTTEIKEQCQIQIRAVDFSLERSVLERSTVSRWSIDLSMRLPKLSNAMSLSSMSSSLHSDTANVHQKRTEQNASQSKIVSLTVACRYIHPMTLRCACYQGSRPRNVLSPFLVTQYMYTFHCDLCLTIPIMAFGYQICEITNLGRLVNFTRYDVFVKEVRMSIK